MSGPKNKDCETWPTRTFKNIHIPEFISFKPLRNNLELFH